ncbi:MAG: DoxX family protein [Bacteroidota bacterium]
MTTDILILSINIILSLIFAFAIYAKLWGVQKAKFIRWGFGRWFAYVAAALELLCVVGLYLEDWRIPAWMMLMTIIVGALITLSRNRESGRKFVLPFSTLALLIGYFVVLQM